MRKEKIVAILLALFLGTLGIHAFYLDNKRHGLTLLMLTLFGPFCALLIGVLIGIIIAGEAAAAFAVLFAVISILIPFVWAFVDFIKLCVISDDDFNSKYNKDAIMNISE